MSDKVLEGIASLDVAEMIREQLCRCRHMLSIHDSGRRSVCA